MTEQGAGGTGGGSGEPDDATRTDWSVGAQPPSEPSAAPTPDPWAPPPSAPPAPDASLVPPAAPPVQQQAPSPWQPIPPGGAWGTQPPEGGRYSVPGAPGLIYAGAIPRAAAWIVDSVIVGIVVAIVSLPFATASTLPVDSTMPFDPSTVYARSGIASLIALIAQAAYFIGLWLSGGRATLGMRLFNLQVGSIADGTKLDPAQAAKRWLAYGSFLGIAAFAAALAPIVGIVQLVWTLALLATTVTSPTKQGLHDRFAGSAIVRPASAGNGLALTCLIFALIIPIIVLFSFIALIFLGGQVSSILSAVGDSV